MKSRQKFTVSEKSSLKRSESDDSRLLKKKNSSNPLLQKNLNFLQTYNNIFRKPFHHEIGDADTYFRKSLRSEPFDIIRDLDLKIPAIKTVRSFDSIKRKPRSKQTLPSAPIVENFINSEVEPKSTEFRELFTGDIKADSDSDSETDVQEHLTPKRNLERVPETEYSSEDEITPKAEDYLTAGDTEETNDMAEEGEIPLESEEESPEGPPLDQPPPEDTIFTSETEDEEMKEVEKMIDDASEQLQQVVEENEKIMDQMEEGFGDLQGAMKGEGEDGGSVFKFDPTIDSAVLKELEEAEKQAKETAAIICELRNRVAELLKKEKMTESEAQELEEKNKQLKSQMILFEEKIKRIQFLISQTNLFDNMIPLPFPLPQKYKEDALPKVIVCGLTENNMPKIIVCNEKKSKKCCSKPVADYGAKKVASPKAEITKKLNECYCMQEKLAAENADLEGKRYQLQTDLIDKDQAVDCLQKQLVNLQTEMRVVCQENALLNQKLRGGCPNSCEPVIPGSAPTSPTSPRKKGPCGKGKGSCPADIITRLEEYSQNTQSLEKQLGDMESEVRGMQKELVAVQKEREHLEHHRKMLCPPPCLMPPCMPHPCMPPPCGDNKGNSDQQLREMKEKYNRLQDDFKNKLTEVAGLRTDNERLKESTKVAEDAKKAAEDKFKELDNELRKIRGSAKGGVGLKEQMIELEQQLNVAKQRFREAQDELDELRSLVEDQKGQMDDYRNKYLEAQQMVEEQRRNMDMMEMENQRISDQVNLEIQRVKNQFQEKLQELMPLPDILKSTQLKLQEAQQMHLLAERNNEAIARELQQYKDKVAALSDEMNRVTSDQQFGADEKTVLSQKIADLERQLADADEIMENLRSEIGSLAEKTDEYMRLAEERLHEITQLESQLESVREESARQIARTKDRCEIVRKSMQNQISELERQMAQSKALAKTAQKDRDDIRQKMQAQINNLNENFEDAQMRIRSLQGHVNFLKNTYGNVYPVKDDMKKLPDPCNCGGEY